MSATIFKTDTYDVHRQVANDLLKTANSITKFHQVVRITLQAKANINTVLRGVQHGVKSENWKVTSSKTSENGEQRAVTLPAKLRLKRSFNEVAAFEAETEDSICLKKFVADSEKPSCANVLEPLNLKITPYVDDGEMPSYSKATKVAMLTYDALEPIFLKAIGRPVNASDEDHNDTETKEEICHCKLIKCDNPDLPPILLIRKTAMGNLKDVLGHPLDLMQGIYQFSVLLRTPIGPKLMLAGASVANAIRKLMGEDLNNMPKNNLKRVSIKEQEKAKLNGMPDQLKELLSQSEDRVVLGPNGTTMERAALLKLNWFSYPSNLMRKILLNLFGKETLAFSSLTGKKSPAFIDVAKPEKEALDPKMVEDVKYFATEVLMMSRKDVHLAITTKCADEQKMFRYRERQREKALAKEQQKKKE